MSRGWKSKAAVYARTGRFLPFSAFGSCLAYFNTGEAREHFLFWVAENIEFVDSRNYGWYLCRNTALGSHHTALLMT
jgi:hypothetical protein